MKTAFKYMAIALAGFAVVGCNNLDTEPLSNVVTSKQKEQVLEKDPSMADAALNSLPQSMKNSTGGYDTHTNYGYASLFLITDSRGEDMASAEIGYNWYTAAASLDDFGGRYYDNLIFWGVNYDLIYASNLIAAVIDPETENTQLQYNLGQALIYRAYAYYNLAQMYQFTYAKNPDALCVPILTPENMDNVAVKGNPRATVAEVYDRIEKDCTLAIELFTKSEEAGYSRADKRFANAAVAYGLRARCYMMTLQWDKCAADAQKAIDLAKAEGLVPASITDVAVPAFINMNDKNWMWAIHTTTSDGYTQGVANFASHMGSWGTNKYATVGCYRSINKILYSKINHTDVRKGWWLNDMQAPSTLPAAYKEFMDQANSGTTDLAPFNPYTQIKFGWPENNPTSTNSSTDQPLMRVEELYLMLAEAQGRLNVSTGVQTLVNFVKTYRDPEFACAAASVEDFVDAVWMQRRIELWGEGFSYYDMMRLQKGIHRKGGGFPASWVFEIDANDPVLLYEIVQTEVQANPLIEDASNGAVSPSPVADDEE